MSALGILVTVLGPMLILTILLVIEIKREKFRPLVTALICILLGFFMVTCATGMERDREFNASAALENQQPLYL